MRAKTFEATQVKCLTADEGHVWMPAYDRLPPEARRRLANSPFNICPACVAMEAEGQGVTHCEMIDRIEEALRAGAK
jgi:hypothetical protein